MQNIVRRVGVWSLVVALILTVPLIAMQMTTEVDWTLGDFVVIGILLFGAALAYELVARRIPHTAHRLLVGAVFLLGVLIMWADLAVGIFNIPGISGN